MQLMLMWQPNRHCKVQLRVTCSITHCLKSNTKPGRCRSFVIAAPHGIDAESTSAECNRRAVCLCLLRVLSFPKLPRVFRQTIIMRIEKKKKRQEWPRYADSTSAFIRSSRVFRKHTDRASVLTECVHFEARVAREGIEPLTLAVVVAACTHRVTPHSCIKSVL